MSPSVKKFIEANIGLIESEMYTELYASAYVWLIDSMCAELTDVLTPLVDVDLKQIALKFIVNIIEIELKNMDWKVISIDTMRDYSLNSFVGIPRADVVEYLRDHPLETTEYDAYYDQEDDNIYFYRKDT